MKCTPTVEIRYEEAGFVYVDDVRMLFAPAMGNRHGHPQIPDTLLLSEGNWGPVRPAQALRAKRALEATFPSHRVLITEWR